MNRAILTLATMALLIACLQARAGSITVNDSGRGWINSVSGPNGNSSSGNYLAGFNEEPGAFRDHFDFPIPNLTGTLTSVVLSLENPIPVGDPNTYSVYSVGAYGTYGFSDIGAGTLYGTTLIDLSESFGGTVTISLNAAAVADIIADQGGTFSLGGVDSGENAVLSDFDFGNSGQGDATSLTLVTTPEPSSLVLLGFGAIGLGALALRRRMRK